MIKPKFNPTAQQIVFPREILYAQLYERICYLKFAAIYYETTSQLQITETSLHKLAESLAILTKQVEDLIVFTYKVLPNEITDIKKVITELILPLIKEDTVNGKN